MVISSLDAPNGPVERSTLSTLQPVEVTAHQVGAAAMAAIRNDGTPGSATNELTDAGFPTLSLSGMEAQTTAPRNTLAGVVNSIESQAPSAPKADPIMANLDFSPNQNPPGGDHPAPSTGDLQPSPYSPSPDSADGGFYVGSTDGSQLSAGSWPAAEGGVSHSQVSPIDQAADVDSINSATQSSDGTTAYGTSNGAIYLYPNGLEMDAHNDGSELITDNVGLGPNGSYLPNVLFSADGQLTVSNHDGSNPQQGQVFAGLTGPAWGSGNGVNVLTEDGNVEIHGGGPAINDKTTYTIAPNGQVTIGNYTNDTTTLMGPDTPPALPTDSNGNALPTTAPDLTGDAAATAPSAPGADGGGGTDTGAKLDAPPATDSSDNISDMVDMYSSGSVGTYDGGGVGMEIGGGSG